MPSEAQQRETEDNPGQNPQASSSPGGLAAIAGSSEASIALAAMHEGGLGVGAPFAQSILIAQRVRVACTSHMHNIDDICERLVPGERLSLKRDADSRDDPWSIHVFSSRGEMVGYVPADVSEMIARMMDAGKCVYGVFTDTERANAWNRVYFEVYLDD